MIFYVLNAFSVAVFALSVTGESTLPVTICKRNAADHSTCLKNAIKEALPRLIPGLPEFDFPSLDPLHYEYGKAILNSGDLRGEIIMSNVTATGIAKVHIFDVRTNLNDGVFRLEIDTQIPKLFFDGNIKLNGTVSVFRAQGKGYFNVTGADVRTTWDMIGPVVNDTWIIEHFYATPLFTKFKMYSNFLSDQSKEFNDLILTFINEFWPAIHRATLPIATGIWDPWLTNFPNKLFSKVPFSKIFPEN
ncbi:uncharacterized protein LOC105834719 isoform X1 [Monomorium pharaonis]|uniref:uncharacterized protein LOC105834719 isoform X1 n=1 Tax=Monomorium pharaonis TaxID=307658 RepID=UPI00063EE7D3|nr:uncharacterized protein LOC105834719 isoform X1 [Monomorium pharaonis]